MSSRSASAATGRSTRRPRRPGFPVGVHAFGFGGNPITASGWPSFYIEEMVGHSQCQQTALASIVLEGVFERYPKLKMVMIEAGFGWAPSLSWRLDKSFERLHSEVPHLKRKPSEYIRDHIYWTTQPMEDPERRDHLFDVIDWIGWDKLLFATDYPHWDFDEPSRVLPQASATPTARRSISAMPRSCTGSPSDDPEKWKPVLPNRSCGLLRNDTSRHRPGG